MFQPKCTRYLPKTLAKIAAVNEPLAVKLDGMGGFITSLDVDALIAVDPALSVLVRCNRERYICRVDELKAKLKTMEDAFLAVEKKQGRLAALQQCDYLRDVSLPVDTHQKAI